MKKKHVAPGQQLPLWEEPKQPPTTSRPLTTPPPIQEEPKPEPSKEAPTLVEGLPVASTSYLEPKYPENRQWWKNRLQTAPRCPTVYSRTKYSSDGTFWHVPNMSEPGGYDIHGNYWCADCKDRLELMNIGEQLGYPEVSYFPHNPEEYRAIMIRPGREMWRRRLAEIWNPDLVKDKVERLMREHKAAIAQQGAVGREE